jgi:hypothetical protein
MSTKIYDGFIFVPKDISTINKKIQEFRHKVDKYVSTVYRQHAADISSYFLDKVCCGLEKNEKKESPFYHAISFLEEESRLIKTSMERNMFDLGCSTTVHLHKKRFYGILFCGNRNINHMWFSQDWVMEYGYWNNTDPLEGVSDKVWEQRGKDWDEMLGDFNDIPSMNGFVAEFTREMYCYIPFAVDEVIPLIPDYPERLRKIAYNQLFDDFDKMRKSGGITQDFFAFDKWVAAGNPGFEKLAKKKDEFANKIKREITKDILIGK